MSRADKKVIILIKHGLYDPYIELARKGQGETFLKHKNSNIEVIHYYGIPGGKFTQYMDTFHEYFRWKNRVSNIILGAIDNFISSPFMLWIPKVTRANFLNLPNTELQVRVIDTLLTLRWKQLAVYKFVLSNYEFDYIYETNASSYVDFDNLLRQVDLFEESPLYAGDSPNGKFISGANRFYDHPSLQALIKNRVRWSPRHLEDVAIGQLMQKCKIKKVETTTCAISSLKELAAIQDSDLIQNYHFRTKSIEGGIRRDPQIMKEIENRLNRIRLQNLQIN